jgi:hypothetical protein
MKKLKPILILLFVLFTSLKAIGQSLTYTFIDPCTKNVTYFSIPIQSGGGTTIFFLGRQRYFTANDVTSGDFASWINQTYADYRKVSPCGVQQARVTQNQITSQIIGSTIQSVVGSIMSQAKSESNTNTDGSDAAGKNNNSGDNKKSKNNKNNTNGGSNTTPNNSGSDGSNNSGGGSQTNSNGSTTSNPGSGSGGGTTGSGSTAGGNTTGGGTTGSGSTAGGNTTGGNTTGGNTTGGNTTGGTGGQAGGQAGGQTGGQTGGQAGGKGSGDNTTKTEGSEVVGTVTMTTDANNDRGTGGSKKSGRTNPVIISSDLTNAQNLDRSYTGIINVGMSQSSMTGTSSWGVNSMIWFNFKQFALTGRYTKIHYSKDHKLKLIHNVNLTGVYSYGNTLGFLGYSAILNAGKWGVTGINISGAVTKTPDDANLFMSPSATAFYTKPFKVGKRLILSPELYIISTPLIYSSVDKVSVSDRTFSAFIGTGVDYQISKRFKVNMNYKLNTSTNPDFPILSFFLIGSKVNL